MEKHSRPEYLCFLKQTKLPISFGDMAQLRINADVLQLSCEWYLSSPERAKKNDNAEYMPSGA